MGNSLSDPAHKYDVEVDDEKIIISHSIKKLQGIIGGRINIKYVSNGANDSPWQKLHAGGCNVRGLEVVISVEDLCKLLDSGVVTHNSRKAAFTSLKFKKLSLKGKTGFVVRMNSTCITCISTRSVQGEGNYNNNWHSWRSLLEGIPEDLIED